MNGSWYLLLEWRQVDGVGGLAGFALERDGCLGAVEDDLLRRHAAATGHEVLVTLTLTGTPNAGGDGGCGLTHIAPLFCQWTIEEWNSTLSIHYSTFCQALQYMSCRKR